MGKKARDRARNSAFEDIFDMMKDDDIPNIYDREDLTDWLQFEFNSDGSMVEYDMLTHELHNYKDEDDENMNVHSAKLEEFEFNDYNIYDVLHEDAYYQKDSYPNVDIYILCITGISLMMLCCIVFFGCFGFGFIANKWVNSDNQEKKESNDDEECIYI